MTQNKQLTHSTSTQLRMTEEANFRTTLLISENAYFSDSYGMLGVMPQPEECQLLAQVIALEIDPTIEFCFPIQIPLFFQR